MEIGDRKFSTKLAAQHYFRQMLRGQIPLDQKLIHALLMRHPDYEEKYANHEEFVLHQGEGPYACFASKKTSGDVIAFSYTTCIDGRGPSERQQFLNVLRSLIIPQIHEAREQMKSCSVCGDSGGAIEIDHARPFIDLFQEWISQFPDDHEFELISYPKEFADPALNANWREFHQKNAVLQPLCIKHHRQKTARTRLCAQPLERRTLIQRRGA